MRIIIKDGKRVDLRIALPTGLALNSLTAQFLPGILEEQGIEITRRQAVQAVQALNQYRKEHPEWVLVEVDSADGEQIRIKL